MNRLFSKILNQISPNRDLRGWQIIRVLIRKTVYGYAVPAFSLYGFHLAVKQLVGQSIETLSIEYALCLAAMIFSPRFNEIPALEQELQMYHGHIKELYSFIQKKGLMQELEQPSYD